MLTPEQRAANKRALQQKVASRPENVKKRREYASINREVNNWRKTVAARQARMSILEILGNKCVKCGFSDERALQIDHINGGGNQEKRAIGNAKNYYTKILKHPELMDRYQLLCANCNWIKRYENNEVVRKYNIPPGLNPPRPEGKTERRWIKPPVDTVLPS